MTGRHRGPGDSRPARRRRALAGAVVLALVGIGAVVIMRSSGPSVAPPGPTASAAAPVPRAGAAQARHVAPASGSAAASFEPWRAPVSAHRAAHLRAGAHPAVLPSALLIADKLNNRLIVVDPQGRIRWQFPAPGDLAPGQTFRVPDDAFFTPDARYIIATQEDQAVISLIDIARHRIVYRYGVPGNPGMAANRLNNPDDAMVLPDHYILTADIKNCRLLLIAPGAHRPARVIGRTTTACLHAPPLRWGSPNGMFPMRNGHYLVTEINGAWVEEIDRHGHVIWSTHPPGVSYPSDTNEIGPGRYLTVDYSDPGRVVMFDRAGHRLWSYRGSGPATLNHPSLALPLPNGDIVLNDDYNHRVVVIDPRAHAIVWQYGVTGVAGVRPGYLNNPDGIDLVPPYSLAIRHPSTTSR